MTKKIVLGGIIGGVLMFIWSAVSHMLLPIGSMGIKSIPNEDAVLAAMKTNITEPGFYFFPGEGMMEAQSGSKEQQDAAMAAWTKKYEAGPRGVMVYYPTGETPMPPSKLIFEGLSDVVGALIAAFLLSMATLRVRSFAGRVGFVTLLGLLAWILIEFSYWNWYGFPPAYVTGTLIDQVVGMAFAGVGIAIVFRKTDVA